MYEYTHTRTRTQPYIVRNSLAIMARKSSIVILVNVIFHGLNMFASTGPETDLSAEGTGPVSFLHRHELVLLQSKGRINSLKTCEGEKSLK